MKRRALVLTAAFAFISSAAFAICPYDANCLNNPYGGRDANAPNGLIAPYSGGQSGSAFSNNPLRNQPLNNPFLPSASPDENQSASPNAPNKNPLASKP